MMKKSAPLAGVFLLLMLCATPWAQQKNNATASKKKAYVPPVTLGSSGFTGGPIKAADFSEQLKKGLSSHDSAGNLLRVVSFNFIYMERMFYEDSASELHVMTDIAKEFCPGNMITDNIAASIYDRIKGGDTVIFDQVLLTKTTESAKKDTFLGKNLKCIITK